MTRQIVNERIDAELFADPAEARRHGEAYVRNAPPEVHRVAPVPFAVTHRILQVFDARENLLGYVGPEVEELIS